MSILIATSARPRRSAAFEGPIGQVTATLVVAHGDVAGRERADEHHDGWVVGDVVELGEARLDVVDRGLPTPGHEVRLAPEANGAGQRRPVAAALSKGDQLGPEVRRTVEIRTVVGGLEHPLEHLRPIGIVDSDVQRLGQEGEGLSRCAEAVRPLGSGPQRDPCLGREGGGLRALRG